MSSKNSKKGKGRKSKYRRIKHQILQWSTKDYTAN
jgi:hypothetical protein